MKQQQPAWFPCLWGIALVNKPSWIGHPLGQALSCPSFSLEVLVLDSSGLGLWGHPGLTPTLSFREVSDPGPEEALTDHTLACSASLLDFQGCED